MFLANMTSPDVDALSRDLEGDKKKLLAVSVGAGFKPARQ